MVNCSRSLSCQAFVRSVSWYNVFELILKKITDVRLQKKLSNYTLQFSGDDKEHELTALSYRQMNIIAITSSIYKFKFIHVQVNLALMAVKLINVESFFSFVSLLDRKIHHLN